MLISKTNRDVINYTTALIFVLVGIVSIGVLKYYDLKGKIEYLESENNDVEDKVNDLEILNEELQNEIQEVEELKEDLEYQLSKCQNKLVFQKSKGIYEYFSSNGIDYVKIDNANVIKPSIANAIKLLSLSENQFESLISDNYKKSGSWSYIANTESCCFGISKKIFLKDITFVNTKPLEVNILQELSKFNYKKFNNPDFYNIYVGQKQYYLSYNDSNNEIFLHLIDNTPSKILHDLLQ